MNPSTTREDQSQVWTQQKYFSPHPEICANALEDTPSCYEKLKEPCNALKNFTRAWVTGGCRGRARRDDDWGCGGKVIVGRIMTEGLHTKLESFLFFWHSGILEMFSNISLAFFSIITRSIFFHDETNLEPVSFASLVRGQLWCSSQMHYSRKFTDGYTRRSTNNIDQCD